jgi:hypothetical protein
MMVMKMDGDLDVVFVVVSHATVKAGLVGSSKTGAGVGVDDDLKMQRR